ncbi:MAG: GNAT family N-acetyltransferase [Thermoflexibacter sp.]|jgi:GNAT superfamily N-acetyltransferase|nr:GNAT family N-acetyltransferase [Thermoflexibacter sp.]
MIFRQATLDDAESIANLHTNSWRQTYRGIMSDAYLDGDIFLERKNTWIERFSHPATNQHVIIAEENHELIGFVCIFGGDDQKFGSLIDNLHVTKALKGKGIGKKLLQQAALWIQETYQDNKMYLWVYELNTNARQVYEKLGAVNYEMEQKENPDGTFATTFRYIWTDLSPFLHGL